MKKILFIILCLFIVLKSIGQNDSIVNEKKRYFEQLNVKIGGGVFIPKGELKDFFGNSPVFEFNSNFLSFKKKSVNIVLQFALPNQSKNFKFIRNIDTVSTKSNLMFNAYLKLNRHVLFTKKNNLKVFFGLGVSTIQLDARNPFYSGQEGEEKYEFVSAILFAPGISYTHNFNKNFKLSFDINYHYSPYKTEGALRENIGSSGVIPKILFTF